MVAGFRLGVFGMPLTAEATGGAGVEGEFHRGAGGQMGFHFVSVQVRLQLIKHILQNYQQSFLTLWK